MSLHLMSFRAWVQSCGSAAFGCQILCLLVCRFVVPIEQRCARAFCTAEIVTPSYNSIASDSPGLRVSQELVIYVNAMT